MKCCFCGKKIEVKRNWKSGNNAMPVIDGRCCDTCNNRIVIPFRIRQAFAMDKFREELLEFYKIKEEIK